MKPTMPRMRSFRQRASAPTRKVLAEEPEAVVATPSKKASSKSSLRLLGRSSRRLRTTDNSLATESTARSSRTASGFLTFKKSKGDRKQENVHSTNHAECGGGGGIGADLEQWASSSESSCKSLSSESSCGSLFVDDSLDNTNDTTNNTTEQQTQNVVMELPLDLKQDAMHASDCPQTPRMSNKVSEADNKDTPTTTFDEYGDSDSEDEEEGAMETNNAPAANIAPGEPESTATEHKKQSATMEHKDIDIPTLTESQETDTSCDDEDKLDQAESTLLEVSYDYYDHSCHDYGEVITQNYATEVVTQSNLPAMPKPKVEPKKLHIVTTRMEENEDARDEVEEYGYVSDGGKYRPATPVQLTMIGDIDETLLLAEKSVVVKSKKKSPRPWQSDSQRSRGWNSFTPKSSSLDSSTKQPPPRQQQHSVVMPL